MIVDQVRVRQCFYDPRCPEKKKRLTVVQPIYFGGETSINVCQLVTNGGEEYRPVILSKSQYFTLIRTHGSLKLKNDAGKNGTISFHNPNWDGEYQQMWNLRNGGKGVQEIDSIDAFTWTELSEESTIENAETIETTNPPEKTPEEIEKARIDKEYDRLIKEMDIKFKGGDFDLAKKVAVKALNLKPASKKAKTVLEYSAPEPGEEDKKDDKGLL